MRRIAERLGLAGPRDERFAYVDNRIQEHFGCDLRQIRPRGRRRWGFQRIEDAPMRDLAIDDIDRWPWPTPTDDMVEGLREEARFLHEQTPYAVCAAQIGQGLFEIGCYLLQHVLPYGSAEEVRALVADLVTHLAPGGGYVLAPCHTLPDDVKPENLIVFLGEARRVGSRDAANLLRNSVFGPDAGCNGGIGE